MTAQTWRELRPHVVEEIGTDELERAHERNQAYIDASRLAERRTALGLTQTDVARRLGITKGRISQIERGEVSTVDVIARYVHALGGRLQISALFGDDRLTLHSTR